ncbi:MAG: dTDP-4-dehydrorhamnose reductase [Saprospiraceae bacterium]|nr:dTDP-4-dehydrorhamnose reductase [Saprospiraceae bacterium]
MSEKVILVTGANGQLGSELQNIYKQYEHFTFLFSDFETLNIVSKKRVFAFFEKNNIDVVINCAAYTAVDKAESDSTKCKAINITGVKNLALACTHFGAILLHISSDYVYHNILNRPLVETDKTSPKSVYAKSKLAGDLAALKNCERTIIFRTSWVYSSFGHNFVKTMLRLGREREQLSVVIDQIGTPTYARDLATTILSCINKLFADANFRAYGIYHYSNEGVTSWFDFATAIMNMRNLSCKVLPINTESYPTPAQRPPFSVLDKSKIKAEFGIEITHWQDSLDRCLRLLI